MNLCLLLIGRKVWEGKAFDFKRLSVLLSDRDYGIDKVFYADDGEAISDVLNGVDDALIVVSGNLSGLNDFFGEAGENTYGYVKIGSRIYVPMEEFDEQTVRNTVIPLLNAKSKAAYNTVVFKTFGKSEDELRELLADRMKSRNNKIVFDFEEDGRKCDVRIRYAKSVQSNVINDTVAAVGQLLGDCVYALKDISLAKQVARSLMASGKRLSIAESFTGGGLSSALVAYPGMSRSLVESIVCYSNEAKMARLNVSETVLKTSGAVSDDAAYEMALGLLQNPSCDIALATTGNAGPTAEKDGQVGLYYLAVGDRTTVHVFKMMCEVQNAENKSVEQIRKEITEDGIETALFELGKYLKTVKGEK